MENKDETIVLLKDSEWSAIDGEACRVTHFSPFATIDNGKIQSPSPTLPYCALTMECKKLSPSITGYVTHKVDFTNLWKVFVDRGVNEKEEVIVYWTVKNYKKGWVKHLGAVMPKLLVWVCRQNTYEALNDPNYNGLSGEAWFDFIRPIVEFKPDVMN